MGVGMAFAEINVSAGEDFMRTHGILPCIFRVLLTAALGVGLGLSIWQLMGSFSWNRDTASIANLIGSLLPLLALAWAGSIIAFCALARGASTRSLGVKWLVTTLTLWVCTTLIVVGVLHSYGTAFPYGTRVPTVMDIINLVSGAAYLASALSLGFIIAPLLILRALLSASSKIWQ
jgi:hypothetical protein